MTVVKQRADVQTNVGRQQRTRWRRRRRWAKLVCRSPPCLAKMTPGFGARAFGNSRRPADPPPPRRACVCVSYAPPRSTRLATTLLVYYAPSICTTTRSVRTLVHSAGSYRAANHTANHTYHDRNVNSPSVLAASSPPLECDSPTVALSLSPTSELPQVRRCVEGTTATPPSSRASARPIPRRGSKTPRIRPLAQLARGQRATAPYPYPCPPH